MKNQSGITLTTLVIAIIMLIIIMGSLYFYAFYSINLKSYYEMCADIEELDEKIALYYITNNEIPILDEYIDIHNLIENYGIENENYNPNNSEKLYKIDLSKLEIVSLNNEEYYIDEQSHTIYSKNGFKVDEKIYYTIPANYMKIE